MTTFVLVHGAWHRAWHWHLVVDELRNRGHHSIAVDLPAEDRSAGATTYAEYVIEAINATRQDDIVLVGHSLGGLSVPVVAQMHPVRRLVLVAPLLPEPGVSWDDQFTKRPDLLHPESAKGQLKGDDGEVRWLPEAARAILYPDAPADLAAEAIARLRPQRWLISREVTPLTAWPDVPTTIVACTGDRVVNTTALREVATHPLVEIPGDHSPMLARPGRLVDLLVG